MDQPSRRALGVYISQQASLVRFDAAWAGIVIACSLALLLYGAVLAVALIGAVAARFRPRGMSRAMFAAALTYAVVTVVALFIWTPSGAAAEPAVRLVNVVVANAILATVWAVSGWLFQRAANAAGSNQNHQMAQ